MQGKPAPEPRSRFELRGFLIGLSIAAVAAVALRYFFPALPLIAWFAIAVVSMLVNGWIAGLEDDWPGGFNNP